MKSKIDIASNVAWSFHGTPYIWGGDDPSGFDCSGFVIEILRSVGLIERSGDWTANDLSKKFIETCSPDEGVLVCYYNKAGDSIVHIEYSIGGGLTIGANGGNATTDSPLDASIQNAFIQVRPINWNRGRVKLVDPFVHIRRV